MLRLAAIAAAACVLGGAAAAEADVSTYKGMRACWQDAGARIATRATQLRFAADEARKLQLQAVTVAVTQRGGIATTEIRATSGERWRVFAAYPDSRQASMSDIILRPRRYKVVAYLRAPSVRQRRAAEACMDG